MADERQLSLNDFIVFRPILARLDGAQTVLGKMTTEVMVSHAQQDGGESDTGNADLIPITKLKYKGHVCK